MVNISYYLTDHCNLNCAGCNHFSPVAEPRFSSLHLFEDNIKALLKIAKVTEFNLMGGEPLLHPDIIQFIEIARKYYSGSLHLITNGLLLDKMSDEFYSCIERNKVVIILSEYNIVDSNIPHKYKDKTRFVYNYLSDVYDITLCDCPFKSKYGFLVLKENGDLHKCSMSGSIDLYNKSFNKDFILIKNDDYINVHNATKITFNKFFFRKRHHFCGYCRTPIIKEWHRYEGIDEWSNLKYQ